MALRDMGYDPNYLMVEMPEEEMPVEEGGTMPEQEMMPQEGMLPEEMMMAEQPTNEENILDMLMAQGMAPPSPQANVMQQFGGPGAPGSESGSVML